MKYFTKEVKIALTAIVAAILLFIGINFLKGKNIFSSTATYHVAFDHIHGLAVSNAVYANGYPVGIVRSIDYDYARNGKVIVAIELNKSMNVPQGTTAELETELMGGVKMSLLLGANPTALLAPGDTISGAMHSGMMAKAEELMPVVVSMLPKLDSILSNLNRLTADPALLQTLQNTADITAELKEASVSLNQMASTKMPQMMTHLASTSANADKLTHNLADIDIAGTMATIDQTLHNAQTLTAQMNSLTDQLDSKLKSNDNTLGLFLNDRGVYDNLNSTMKSADSLLIDFKAHPKRYIHFSVFGKKDK